MGLAECCSLCVKTRRVRRGLCWTCYRKLRVCGIELPARALSGPPMATVVDLLRTWPHAARARLAAALSVAQAGEAPAEDDADSADEDEAEPAPERKADAA